MRCASSIADGANIIYHILTCGDISAGGHNMQELEAHLANARFARRHLSKMAGIGLAALVATLTMPKPVQARHGEDNDHDRDDRGDGWGGHGHGGYDPNCFLKGTRIRTIAGEHVVEDLAIGDLLPTHSNGIRPIQWIGCYQVTTERCFAALGTRCAACSRRAFGPRARRAARGFVRVAATRHLTFLRIA